MKCKKVKIKYHAETAIKMHNAVQRVSRTGTKVDAFPQEFKDYLSRLIKNGILSGSYYEYSSRKYQMFKSAPF